MKALIDLGTTGNFINKEFVWKINYKKEILELYDLLMFNKTPLAYNDEKIIYNLGNIRL